MARQGHRVWLARLSFGGILLACLIVIGVKVAWDRLSEPILVTKPNDNGSVQVDSRERHLDPSDVVHALDPVLQLARNALKHHASEHRDYTAVLAKRERVGGKLLSQSRMQLKLRYESKTINDSHGTLSPRKVSVYLKTTEPKSQAGREVIWKQDVNNNKLNAHEGGLLGLMTVQLAPQSRLAMAGNRYPITEIGIEQLLFKLIEKGERDKAIGPVTVLQRDGIMVDGVPCTLIEVVHEQKELLVHDQKIEFEFHRAQIYIDPKRWVPIKYASYSWPKSESSEPELDEEYTYEQLEFNVGLTDTDFDIANPEYRFSK